MKITIKLPKDKLVQELRKKYKIHRDFYKEYNIEEKNDYHPDDNDFFECEGWKKFVKDYPEIIRENEWKEVDIISTRDMLFILLTTAQYLFQKLSLQASLGIRTDQSERMLLQIKQAITYTEGYDYCFWGNGYSFKIGEDTPLSTLRSSDGNKYYFIQKKGEDEVVLNEKQIDIFRKCLYFFNLNEDVVLPPLPVLKWTGKELVAIHIENIPKSLLDKGILQIEHQEEVKE